MFGFETAFSAMWEYAMDYVRQLWLPVLLAGGVYLAVSVARSRKRGLQVPPARRGVMLVFVCYCAGLAGLTLTPPNFWYGLENLMRWGIWPPEWVKLLGQGGLNWVPTVYRFLSGTTTYTRWWEILDVWNIAMFVPLGIFLTVLWKKLASWRGLAAGAGVSLGIELFQPLVGRSFDVDDLIHNVLGVAAGLLIGLLLCRVASGLAGKIRGEANTAGG